MKNMKKLFGLVLCLMTGMLCMVNVDAAEAVNVNIDKAILTIEKPVFGDSVNQDKYKKAMLFIRKYEGGQYKRVQGSRNNSINILKWVDANGDEVTDTFGRGVYKPVFEDYVDDGHNNDTFKVTDDTEFTINPVYVNGKTTIDFKTSLWNVTGDVINTVVNDTETGYERAAYKEGFTVYEPVDELDLTVTEPVNNEKPCKTATLESKVLGAVKVTEVPVEWYVSSDAIVYSVEPMGENDVFEYGKYYTYVVADEFDLKTTLNDYFKLTDDYKVLYNGVENCAFGPIPHTYKFMDNSDKQNATVGKLTKYSFRVDAEMGDLEEVKIGDLVLVAEEDYTETAGSIIVTLTKKGLEKVNKLKAGTYEVNVKFYGLDNKTVGTLTLNNPNPETSDNILLYVTISMISLSTLAVAILRKKSYN